LFSNANAEGYFTVVQQGHVAVVFVLPEKAYLLYLICTMLLPPI